MSNQGKSLIIRNNIERVLERIEKACRSAGRKPSEITLLAVSKTFGLEEIQAAADCGLTAFGENKIQESVRKYEALGNSVRWHFIGHLQTNKVKFAVKVFDWIHTVDSLKLLEKLSQKAVRNINVLVQLNLAGEEQKSGLSFPEALTVITAASSAPNLSLKGVMAIPPYSPAPENSRPHFKEMFLARQKLERETGLKLEKLSIGMSHDFEVAIQEGADIIRVGSAIFGPRSYKI
ncbi:MAG: YggS family pyridoxal phosphate-dependent enzyme [bacterium]